MISTKSAFVVLAVVVISCSAASDVSNHPNLDLLPKECGKVYGTKELNQSGQPDNATLGQFPWMALLGYKENGKVKYRCYGALINEQYIVTTTGCAMDCSNGVPIVARFGEVNITTEKGCDRPECVASPLDVEIEDVLINAKFRKLWKNNIALLRLKEPVKVNKYVSPICLPLEGPSNGDLREQTVFVNGWVERSNVRRFPAVYSYSGFNKIGGAGGAENQLASDQDTDDVTSAPTSGTPSNKPCRRCNRLRGLGYLEYYADLVIDSIECRAQFGQGIECTDCIYATEGTLCTEADPSGDNKRDCSRQHGAPVAYYNNATETYHLVGIVLQSESYCEFAAPVLSTKIADHLQFILDGIKK